MRVRALDINNDWTYGKGKNNYLSGMDSIRQKIQCRLKMHVGECWFDLTAGVDWFGLLGGKDLVSLRLSISSTILNTTGVQGITQMTFELDPSTRAVTGTYQVQTIYGLLAGTFQFVPTV